MPGFGFFGLLYMGWRCGCSGRLPLEPRKPRQNRCRQPDLALGAWQGAPRGEFVRGTRNVAKDRARRTIEQRGEPLGIKDWWKCVWLNSQGWDVSLWVRHATPRSDGHQTLGYADVRENRARIWLHLFS
jgi:hypothetical protein